MLDQDVVSPVDLTDVDAVEKMVREIALMICEEQPDMPEPQSLADLDSFSVVQVLLEVENTTGRKLLEKFEDFVEGEEFRDLAAHIVKIVAKEDAEIAAAAAGLADPEAPSPAEPPAATSAVTPAELPTVIPAETSTDGRASA